MIASGRRHFCRLYLSVLRDDTQKASTTMTKSKALESPIRKRRAGPSHMSSRDDDDDKPYFCDICDKRFKAKGTMTSVLVCSNHERLDLPITADGLTQILHVHLSSSAC